MVLPVTGPHTKVVDIPKVRWLRHNWYRQKKPYDRPLPRTKHEAFMFSASRDTSAAIASHYGNLAEWVTRADLYQSAYAQAYERLVGKLGDPASLGVTLGQWKQANDMIAKRASQLSRFTVALARRTPVGVAASLGLRLKDVRAIMRTRYGSAKKLSDLWLEFWFGWKPMVNDIYAACEVFDGPIPCALFKGKGKSERPGYLYFRSDGGACSIYHADRCSVTLGASVRIVNPNLRLLQQFGVLNPAEIAFDMVPWSFVLGWFSNVSSWIASFSNFAGLEVSNGYVSSKSELSRTEVWPEDPDNALLSCSGLGVYEDRILVGDEIPRPVFRIGLQDLKPARALTAITLLTQKLPRH